MSTERIDLTRISTRPLAERDSKLAIEEIALSPEATPPDLGEPLAGLVEQLATQLQGARRRGASVILVYGAHVIKNGCGPLLVWLTEQGWVTHLATQGAGIIHDWEFAYAGRSSESVAENTPAGRFGTWDETGLAINLAALAGGAEGLGLGEAVGRFINNDGWVLPMAEGLAEQIAAEPGHPLSAARADLLAAIQRFDFAAGPVRLPHSHKSYSVTAAAARLGVPLTVHPGIGYDIFSCHPLFSPAAIGRGAGVDFATYASAVSDLDGGVLLSVGSAIMSPQIFEKALSIANNLRLAEGRSRVADHTAAVVDIQPGGDWDWADGEPPENHPAYYLRFCKSFYRLADRVAYLQGDNRAVLGGLIARLRQGKG